MLLKIVSTIFAGLVAPAILEQTAARAQTKPTTGPILPALPDPEPDEDPLIRMMRNLQRALQKPVEQRRWVMVIDLRKCTSCHACTIGCVAKNKLPPGVVYRLVLEEEIGTFTNSALAAGTASPPVPMAFALSTSANSTRMKRRLRPRDMDRMDGRLGVDRVCSGAL